MGLPNIAHIYTNILGSEKNIELGWLDVGMDGW